MPPKNRLATLKPYKRYITCFNCKRPVGRIQEKKGKAFCYRCQQDIFGQRQTSKTKEKSERMMTPKDWIREHR